MVVCCCSRWRHDVLERMAALPGVQSAGAVSAMPFVTANIGVQTPIRFMERPPPGVGESPNVYTTVATNGYFETMGVSLRRGRTFTAADNATGAPVAPATRRRCCGRSSARCGT